jgi:hypothetical protein
VSIADLEWKSPFVAAVAIVRVSFSLAAFRSETYRFSRMAAANGFFTNGLFAWMTIYLPELFPTRVRGRQYLSFLTVREASRHWVRFWRGG